MNIKNIKKDGLGAFIISCGILVLGWLTYRSALQVYVYSHGKDVEVTVTQKDYGVRGYNKFSFEYEGKTCDVQVPYSLGIKVGDIVHVRKCEDIDLFMASGESKYRVWFGLIFWGGGLLFMTSPIWGYLIGSFVLSLLANSLVGKLHKTPFRYSKLVKKFKHWTECQYDIVSVDDVKYEIMSNSTCVAIGYCKELKDAVIPTEINLNGIGYKVIDVLDNCFKGCTSLTSFNLQVSIPSLCDSFFEKCSSLTSINLPSSITSLGNSCFEGCTSLTSINLPDSVTELGDYCFEGCTSLKSITLSDSISSIGKLCFEGCTSLTSINLPDSVTELGDYCFRDCTSLRGINLSTSITSLGNSCFKGCSSMTSFNLPDSVAELGDYCFSGCTSLTNINLPDSVAELGDYCFRDCTSLISINLPASSAELSRCCFKGCTSLSDITLPDSITTLGVSCFEGCTSLKSITLHDSISSIGELCFKGCTSLTSINLPDSVTELGDYCFQGCTSLRDINLPASITTLGKSCFEDCKSLTNIKLPEKLFHVNLGKCPYAAKHERLVELNTLTVCSFLDGLNKEAGRECAFATGIGENYCEISLFSLSKQKTFVYKITELPDKIEEIKNFIETLDFFVTSN